LFQVVDQRAQLSALELIGAMRQDLHSLDVYGARHGFVQPARGRLHAHFFKLAAELLELVFLGGELRLQSLGEIVGRGEILAGYLRQLEVAPERVQRAQTADGFNATHARGNRLFARQLEQSDLARGRSVRAAAELGRKTVAEAHHAHLVAVLLSEERHRVVFVHRHVDRNVFQSLDLRVGQHLAIDDVLNLL
jgi:hypothetical protein